MVIMIVNDVYYDGRLLINYILIDIKEIERMNMMVCGGLKWKG